MTVTGRRYGGADPEERRARRRAELIAAGLDLWGTEGFAAASIKRICDHAGLTQRYFYESFTDRNALLTAVYDECVRAARADTVAAVAEFLPTAANDSGIPADDIPSATRAALGAFLHVLATDARRARIILVEVVGIHPDLERTRMAAIHEWADLILTLTLGSQTPRRSQRLAAIGLVGAVTQLLVDWYTGTTGEFASDDVAHAPDLFELDAILDVCVEMFTATHHRLLG